MARTTVALQVHEAAEAFPMMDAARFAELKADIEQHGQREPIALFDNKILDGRNRYRACDELGIEPLTRDVTGELNPWDFVWSLNGQRRDLSADHRAQIWVFVEAESGRWGAAREEIANKANAKRSAAAIGNKSAAKQRKEYRCTVCDDIFDQIDLGHCPSCGHHYPAGDPCSNCHFNPVPVTMEPVGKNSAGTKCTTTVSDDARHRLRKEKAEVAGVNMGALARAEALASKRPDLAEKVRTGEIKPAEARRQAKRDEVSERAADLPVGKYAVLYADPPWEYGDGRTGDRITATGALHHYPTMSMSDLKALDVPSLAADDCVLFLWATSPLLPEGLDLCRAWGFTYKASFIWDKVKHNLGHYNSVRHEFLLVGTRGSATPQVSKLFDSVQSIERTDKHSEKPQEFRDIIETLYPRGARLELFARQEHQGWSAWGNEC